MRYVNQYDPVSVEGFRYNAFSNAQLTIVMPSRISPRKRATLDTVFAALSDLFVGCKFCICSMCSLQLDKFVITLEVHPIEEFP